MEVRWEVKRNGLPGLTPTHEHTNAQDPSLRQACVQDVRFTRLRPHRLPKSPGEGSASSKNVTKEKKEKGIRERKELI